MGFLEDFGYWLVLDVLRLQKGSALAESAAFFTYDIIKVFALLTVMVFLVSIVRTFVTPQRIKKLLAGKNEFLGNVLAALLGIPTPFCSCSAVPIFIGLVESGVPLGVTFSFLIASPTINEVAIALLFGLFGWQITALYIGTGLVIAILAGFAIGKMGLESEVEDFVYKLREKKAQEKKMNWGGRIEFAKHQTADIVKKVAIYIVVGIGIGALIHGYAPTDFLLGIAGKDNPLAVPIVVLIGIPLYSNAAGTIPIVQALMAKGMAAGTALAFMMSVTALSLPEMVILRKVLKPKLLAAFAGVLFIAFVLTGLLFNMLI